MLANQNRNIAAFIAMLAMAGCAGTKPPVIPLAPTGVLSQSRTYLGTPLSGPLADMPPAINANDSLAVTVWFVALGKIPAEAYPLLGDQVRLIVASRENSPVLPSGRLTNGVRIIETDGAEKFLAEARAGKFGPSAVMWTGVTPLLPGATVDFSAADSRGVPDVLPGQIAGKRLAVDLYRPGTNGLAAAILMDGYVNTAPPKEIEEAFKRAEQPTVTPGRRDRIAPRKAEAAPLPKPELQSEIAVFDRAKTPDSFALIVPMQFENSLTQAVLIVVNVAPASADVAYQKLVAQAQADIEAASVEALRQAKSIGVDPPDWPGLSSAVQSLAFAARQRAGLLFLSQQTGADITQDVTLTANDAVLSDLAAAEGKAIASAPGAVDRATIGWILERATLRMLMQFQSGGKLPPELAAILANRAGQAGRNSGTLEEVLANAMSRQDFENRLAAENYIFLEDSSPSARVRAFDWLTARHLAPPDYDPLASVKSRRDALEKAEQNAPGAQATKH